MRTVASSPSPRSEACLRITSETRPCVCYAAKMEITYRRCHNICRITLPTYRSNITCLSSSLPSQQLRRWPRLTAIRCFLATKRGSAGLAGRLHAGHMASQALKRDVSRLQVETSLLAMCPGAQHRLHLRHRSRSKRLRRMTTTSFPRMPDHLQQRISQMKESTNAPMSHMSSEDPQQRTSQVQKAMTFQEAWRQTIPSNKPVWWRKRQSLHEYCAVPPIIKPSPVPSRSGWGDGDRPEETRVSRHPRCRGVSE